MKYNFSIQSIGERKFSSPLKISRFTHDENRLLFKTHIDNYAALKDDNGDPLSVELAGPRSKIFFKPAETKAVIVTCGGLCPGINDVIRSITLTLFPSLQCYGNLGGQIWSARLESRLWA